MPSQASSLLSAKLRYYFSGLPSHFEAGFGEFSALPGHSNHAFHSRGSSFLRFSLFSFHIVSCLFLWRLFGRFSGPLGTSRRASGRHFPGQKGRGRIPAPSLLTALVFKFPSRLPNGASQAPKRPQNLPKSFQNASQKTSILAPTEVLFIVVLLFIVIPPSSFSTT